MTATRDVSGIYDTNSREVANWKWFVILVFVGAIYIAVYGCRITVNDIFFSGCVILVCYYTPASTKLIGGYTGITLSVCPSVDRIVSALYLQQYSSDPFHICTSYQGTSEGVSRVMPVSKFKNVKFWRIFKICNFDFVIFWLGIQYDSMVWVIMRRRGVSSERWRFSCSSFCLV